MRNGVLETVSGIALLLLGIFYPSFAYALGAGVLIVLGVLRMQESGVTIPKAWLESGYVKKKLHNGLVQDAGIVILSILLAVILVRTDVLVSFLVRTQELGFIGSFIAGIFFTSIFTAAPAMVTLGELTQEYSLFLTIVAGAAGAVVGDLLIFHFIKDRFSGHLMELIQTPKGSMRARALFTRGLFRWVNFLIGGLILASPLPDEIGVALLGFSKMDMTKFILLSFALHAVGILFIGLAAQALA